MAKHPLQNELAQRARAATTHLGELRDKHGISNEDWAPIAEHHNAIIALAQEALDAKVPKPAKRKKK